MRRLALLFLACSAWSQVVPPPTVRDAYVPSGGVRVREARLKDDLEVTVCKAEYDDWVKDKKPEPTLSLYMDGRLMKGLAAVPAEAPSDPKVTTSDKRTKDVQNTCAEELPAVATAEKIVADRKAEAKSAAEKASAELDADKKKWAQKEADDKALAAQTAQENLDALKLGARATYAVQYYLDPQFAAKSETKEPWIRLLEQPWEDRPVNVSVGTDNGRPWPSEATIGFKRLNVWLLACWAVLFLFAVILFVRYAKTSDILRDMGTLPAPAAGQKAYSLARTQMALWTFLVAGALVFIFLVTWIENTITAGVLTLIGISFGTTLLAATADGTQPTPPQPTKGFIADLLSDGGGPSFHRYQMVLFTVVLAAIFVVKAATSLVMPEFDMTLLGLMGISSG